MRGIALLSPAFSAAAMMGLAVEKSEAALLVQESFSGYTTGTINGQTASGTGLSGNYASTGGFSYTNSGLSFGGIATSGGAITISTTGANAVGVALNPVGGAVTGDLFSSYLFNKPASFSTATNSLVEGRVNTSATGDSSTASFRSQSNTDQTGNNVGVGYDATATGGTGAMSLNTTTYLVISKYTNVGSTLDGLTTGESFVWVLTSSQLANVRSLPGGLNEANLNSLTVGSLSTNIFGRGSDAAVTSGTFVFDNTRFLQLAATGSAGSSQGGTLDEFRFGTTLDDVTPVPEPSSFLLLLSAVPLLRRKR
jgi:hypothetical protein